MVLWPPSWQSLQLQVVVYGPPSWQDCREILRRNTTKRGANYHPYLRRNTTKRAALTSALFEAQYHKVMCRLGYQSRQMTLLRLSARSELQGLVRFAHALIRHSRSPWVRPPAVWGGVTTPWKKCGTCAGSFGPREKHHPGLPGESGRVRGKVECERSAPASPVSTRNRRNRNDQYRPPVARRGNAGERP